MVLTSNASPLSENTGNASRERRLQSLESLEDHQDVQTASQGSEYSRLENYDSPTPEPSDSSNLTQLDGQSHPSHLYPVSKPDAEGRKHTVWQRIKGTITELERQSPKYYDYRRRLRKYVDQNGEVLWSDEVEDAFQIALRKNPPIGKRKTHITQRGGHKKSCGRNECIARTIYKLTGKVRKRKQISSHIQVLNDLIKGNMWTKLTKTNELDNEKHGTRAVRYDEAHAGLIFVEPGSSNIDKRPLDTAVLPSLSLTICSTSRPFAPSIQKIEYKMCVYPPLSDHDVQRTASHVYTTMQSEMGAEPRCHKDIPNWQSNYPDLADQYNGGGFPKCEIIFLDSNLSLMDNLPAERSPLGIHLYATVKSEEKFHSWSYRTTFYEDGKQANVCSNPLHIDRDEATGQTQIDIPLESSWWVKLFYRITKRRQEVQAKGNAKHQANLHSCCDCDSCNQIKKMVADANTKEEEQARRYLREMTIMQEIYGINGTGEQKVSHPIAIFLWRFRQTRGNETATTTWRKLNQPPVNTETRIPVPSTLKTPVLLESSVEHRYDQPTIPLLSSSAHVEEQQSYPGNWNHWSQIHPALFAKPLEECYQFGTSSIGYDGYSGLQSSQPPSARSGLATLPCYDSNSSFETQTPTSSFPPCTSSQILTSSLGLVSCPLTNNRAQLVPCTNRSTPARLSPAFALDSTSCGFRTLAKDAANLRYAPEHGITGPDPLLPYGIPSAQMDNTDIAFADPNPQLQNAYHNPYEQEIQYPQVDQHDLNILASSFEQIHKDTTGDSQLPLERQTVPLNASWASVVDSYLPNLFDDIGYDEAGYMDLGSAIGARSPVDGN